MNSSFGTAPVSSDGQASLLTAPFDLEPVDESLLATHGEVFTRRWVVEMILDLAGYVAERDLVGLKAVEPSCGTGAFLLPMVMRLMDSAESHGRSLDEATRSIAAWDLLGRNVEASRIAVEATLSLRGLPPEKAKQLASKWVNQADFLLEPPEEQTVDVVVGNPPYIRLEAVAPMRSRAYRQSCPTMGGRSDVYVGFYEKGLKALRADGVLAFICADRWMRNAYGARLREMISEGWSVEAIINMFDVDAFESEVDAYPAVTVIRRGEVHAGPLVADADSDFGPADAAQLVELEIEGVRSEPQPKKVRGERRAFRAERLSTWFSGKTGWPNASPERLGLLTDLESRLPTLEDIATGTRVGIGVATGADKVFITKEPQGIEEARLVPLALSSDISSGTIQWSGNYLVNPWDEDGLVDLDDWPGFREYLSTHEERLRGRHTARSGKWHRTIDKVNPALMGQSKLYLPDFKEATFPVLDTGSTYPHHNLYWVTSDEWDLEVLGGLLLSDVANLFIEAYSVRMRGGYLRFQAQYLRRIRLPDIDDVDVDSAEALVTAFRRRDRSEATETALALYGIECLPD